MREANDSLDHIMVHFGSPTNLVRLEGLEPSTLALEGRCSIQLSYRRSNFSNDHTATNLVGVERFELPTSCSQSRHATRLRYTPMRGIIHRELLRSKALIRRMRFSEQLCQHKSLMAMPSLSL